MRKKVIFHMGRLFYRVLWKALKIRTTSHIHSLLVQTYSIRGMALPRHNTFTLETLYNALIRIVNPLPSYVKQLREELKKF